MTDEVVLRDGSRLVLRPIRPQDGPALLALHARLSTATVHRRYFGARPHLAPDVVDRFTRVDEPWRFALVAVRGHADLVAVARYEGAAGSTSAELAMVVDDTLHRHGIGRILLGRLLDVAVERGLRTIVAEVLPANGAMLGLLHSAAGPVQTRNVDGVVEVRIDLAGRTPIDADRAIAQAHLVAAGAPPAPPDR